MTSVKAKYRNTLYTHIDIGVEGLKLVDENGAVVMIQLNLKEPNMLYKLQDIKKSIKLFEGSKATLSLDEMLDSNGVNHLFTVDVNGKILYSKSSLHSTFGKLNKSLFPTRASNETIFIVREDKSIIALLNRHYVILYKNGKVQRDIQNIVSKQSYKLFKQLCKELNKVDEVQTILTKVV